VLMVCILTPCDAHFRYIQSACATNGEGLCEGQFLMLKCWSMFLVSSHVWPFVVTAHLFGPFAGLDWLAANIPK